MTAVATKVPDERKPCFYIKMKGERLRWKGKYLRRRVMKDEEPRWVDKAHQMTGVSKEELKRMSWSKVERLLGIELEEPPMEVKLLIRGGYFAMRKRWITKKEVDSLHMEINKLMKKYGIQP